MSRFVLGNMLFISKNPESESQIVESEEPTITYPRLSKVKKQNNKEIKKTIYNPSNNNIITIDDIKKIKKLKKSDLIPKNYVISKILENTDENIENINKIIKDITEDEFAAFRDMMDDLDINLSDDETETVRFNYVNDMYVKKSLTSKEKLNMLLMSMTDDISVQNIPKIPKISKKSNSSVKIKKTIIKSEPETELMMKHWKSIINPSESKVKTIEVSPTDTLMEHWKSSDVPLIEPAISNSSIESIKIKKTTSILDSSYDRDSLLSSYSNFKPSPKTKSIVEISENIDEIITESLDSKLLSWTD